LQQIARRVEQFARSETLEARRAEQIRLRPEQKARAMDQNARRMSKFARSEAPGARRAEQIRSCMKQKALGMEPGASTTEQIGWRVEQKARKANSS
jgi:hypothetical protein